MAHDYCSQIEVNNLDEQDEWEEINASKGTDELLIDAVRGYPHLYNSSLKEYRNVHMKENSWNEIASLMNMSIAACQNRWLRLRERFSKEQRLLENESRSGSGVSHRMKFPLYNNMLFLGNHIKRRKSYTNITTVPMKKSAVNISHVSSDRQHGIYTQPSQIISNTQNNIESPSKIHFSKTSQSDADIVSQQLQIGSQINFSSSTNVVTLNSVQTPKNVTNYLCNTRDTNILQLKQNPSNPICSSREVNRFETESDVLSLSSSDENPNLSSYNVNEVPKSSTLKTVTSALQKNSCHKTAIRNWNNINKKGNTYLETSLANLSDVLQNRMTNQRSTEKDMCYSNTNLTPERSFGILVATHLEAIPEPERSKRKLAIAEILWKSL